MSGGSYGYAFQKIESLAGEIRPEGSCYCAPPHLRRAFKAHLLRCAEAARAIEWNDSCDGDRGETDKILACVGPTGDLETAIAEGKKVTAELLDAIERAMAQEVPR